ncbi:hypothetical protein MICA_1893 [Micavibrio aeruginosavorus ARL-13]|uniref:Uncharacterized protein n=1 Tax=Micavibrio aeruginosavorus (strain ARL-13) TaxID=856793 RepID=G2KMA8_MICAA|nr:hypothetical protein MICA_1893 [Micavibrio aeruginosavorus ARL-13]
MDAVELTTRDSMGDDSPLKEPSRHRSAEKPRNTRHFPRLIYCFSDEDEPLSDSSDSRLSQCGKPTLIRKESHNVFLWINIDSVHGFNTIRPQASGDEGRDNHGDDQETPTAQVF